MLSKDPSGEQTFAGYFTLLSSSHGALAAPQLHVWLQEQAGLGSSVCWSTARAETMLGTGAQDDGGSALDLVPYAHQAQGFFNRGTH